MPVTTSEKTQFVLETSSLRFVQVEAPDHQSALIAAQLLACEAHRDYSRASDTVRDVVDSDWPVLLGDCRRNGRLEMSTKIARHDALQGLIKRGKL